MRHFIPILIFCFFCNLQLVAQSCDSIPEFIVLSTQKDVDDFLIFYPNCSEFNNLSIGGTPTMASDINNLDALSGIETINGRLTIANTDQLTNLNGLSNISSWKEFDYFSVFAATLLIENNSALTDISALGSLPELSVTLHIQIINNPVLNSLTGFENLTDAFITIDNNDALVNLNGFQSLVTGYLHVFNNDNLTSLNGINSLQNVTKFLVGTGVYIGGVSISNNPNITSLAPLSNLTTIQGGLRIDNSTGLTDLTGLNNVTSITDGLGISNNDSLLNLSGLENVIDLTNDLTGFTHSLAITDNAVLSSIAELGISGMGQNVTIDGNPMLSACNVPYVCVLLNNPTCCPPNFIFDNASGCDGIVEVTNQCNGNIDADQDGFSTTFDCDDNNSAVNPDATEIPYNGIDDDCNPATLDDDLDQDGFANAADCDDNNIAINPDATEIPYNGIDEDCNAATLDDDLDQDGFNNADDCDDNNVAVNPNATEIPYNGIDDDCNTVTLEDDLDQDGFNNGADCDDNNFAINPNATDIPNNGIDEDCADGDLIVDDIEDIKNLQPQIFPNPTTGKLIIQLPQSGEAIIQLSNYVGSTLISKKIFNRSEIELQALGNGIYLLEIQMDGNNWTERVVKVKY